MPKKTIKKKYKPFKIFEDPEEDFKPYFMVGEIVKLMGRYSPPSIQVNNSTTKWGAINVGCIGEVIKVDSKRKLYQLKMNGTLVNLPFHSENRIDLVDNKPTTLLGGKSSKSSSKSSKSSKPSKPSKPSKSKKKKKPSKAKKSLKKMYQFLIK